MKDCSKCCHVKKTTNHIGNVIRHEEICTLCRKILFKNCVEDCNYYNLDLSNEKICMNCKHFLGGGDWGLSCMKDYYKLPNKLSKACVEFERKDKESEELNE